MIDLDPRVEARGWLEKIKCPGIQNDSKADLFDLDCRITPSGWRQMDCRVMPGNDKKETSPGMTKEKKSPAMTKEKDDNIEKNFY